MFSILPKLKKDRAPIEVVVNEIKRITTKECANKFENQIKVMLSILSKNKKSISLRKYVRVSRLLDYITTKVGVISIETLLTVIYRLLDDDYTASLSKTNIMKFLKLSGLEYKKRNVMQTISELDDNGDGVIQINEFLMLLKKFIRNPTDYEQYLVNINVRTKNDIHTQQNLLKSTSFTVIKTPRPSERKDSEIINITREMAVAMIKTNLHIDVSNDDIFKLFFDIAEKETGNGINQMKYSLIEQYFKENNTTTADNRNEEVIDRYCFKLINDKRVIGPSELCFICSKIGIDMDEQQAVKVIAMYDDDRNNVMVENEFITYINEDNEIYIDDTVEESEEKTKRVIKRTFRIYDKEHSGYIDLEHCYNVFLEFWGEISDNNKKCIKAAFFWFGNTVTITENEFLVMCMWLMPKLDENNEIDLKSEIADLFDKLEVNHLDHEMLFKFLLKFNPKMDETKVDSIIKMYEDTGAPNQIGCDDVVDYVVKEFFND